MIRWKKQINYIYLKCIHHVSRVENILVMVFLLWLWWWKIKWQQNDNTILWKSTQQVENRQNILLFTSKTNKKHHTTTWQRRVWIEATSLGSLINRAFPDFSFCSATILLLIATTLFSIIFSWLSLTLIVRKPDDCGISFKWSFFVASGWFYLMRYLVVLTQVQTEVGLLHLSRCPESAALHMWYLQLQADGGSGVGESVACNDSRLCISSCCLCGNRWE